MCSSDAFVHNIQNSMLKQSDFIESLRGLSSEEEEEEELINEYYQNIVSEKTVITDDRDRMKLREKLHSR